MANIKQDMQQSPSLPACRVRSACDSCHHSKVKCSGGNPCSGCHKLGLRCNYSSSNRTGRPRGIKNKGTRQRLRAHVRGDVAPDRDAAGSSLSLPSAASLSADPTASMSASRQSPSPCNLPTDINAPEWRGFDAHQMDTMLMACLDPSSADIDDVSSTKGLLYTPNSSSYSLLSSMPLPVPPRPTPQAFDFEGAHHPRSCSVLSSSSSSSSPSSFSASFSSHLRHESCDCLQELAALFAQLKLYARRGDQLLQAAVAVSHVRAGVSAWKRHLQCTACMESADGDSFLLCVMEIRMVLPLIEWVSNNLDLGGQVAFSLHATPVGGSCEMPVAYELARGESQAIMRTLLLRSMDSIIDILTKIQERPSPTQQPGGLPSAACGLNTPQASPPCLSSPGCIHPLSVLESPGGLQGLFGQSLQSLIESAENLQKRIARD